MGGIPNQIHDCRVSILQERLRVLAWRHYAQIEAFFNKLERDEDEAEDEDIENFMRQRESVEDSVLVDYFSPRE